MRAPASYLARHGAAVVAFACFVVGLGYAATANDGSPSEGRWRVAHAGGVANGMLLLAAAAAVPAVSLSSAEAGRMARGLAATAWCNSFGYTVGAATGERGLSPVCATTSSPVLLWWCGELWFARSLLCRG